MKKFPIALGIAAMFLMFLGFSPHANGSKNTSSETVCSAPLDNIPISADNKDGSNVMTNTNASSSEPNSSATIADVNAGSIMKQDDGPQSTTTTATVPCGCGGNTPTSSNVNTEPDVNVLQFSLSNSDFLLDDEDYRIRFTDDTWGYYTPIINGEIITENAPSSFGSGPSGDPCEKNQNSGCPKDGQSIDGYFTGAQSTGSSVSTSSKNIIGGLGNTSSTSR